MAELGKQESLRVLMTTDTVGGVWSYAVELCKSLHSYSVHFDLVTTGAPLQTAQKEDVKHLPNVTVHETHFLLEWMENPWENIDASGKWLLQLEEKCKPHIIHINGFVYGSLPWKAPVIVVAHSDVFSWFHSVKKTSPPDEWNEYFKRVKAGLQSADYLIAPSQWMMNEVRTIYAAITPGAVIYNGRSQDHFYPKTKQDFIFSMGRIWDEAKNMSLLVTAADQIRYPVRLAGDTTFSGNNTKTAVSAISYLGKLSLPEVAEQLAAAKVYVMPAKYEPFGLSVLEAALSRCALVLGKVDSLQEIWGESALYIDTDDADALAEAANRLMQDKALCEHYAEAAMQRAKRYATEAMAEQYWRTYQNMQTTNYS